MKKENQGFILDVTKKKEKIDKLSLALKNNLLRRKVKNKLLNQKKLEK